MTEPNAVAGIMTRFHVRIWVRAASLRKAELVTRRVVKQIDHGAPGLVGPEADPLRAGLFVATIDVARQSPSMERAVFDTLRLLFAMSTATVVSGPQLYPSGEWLVSGHADERSLRVQDHVFLEFSLEPAGNVEVRHGLK